MNHDQYTAEQAEPIQLALAFLRATIADDLPALGHIWDRVDELRAESPDDMFTSALAHVAWWLGRDTHGDNLDAILAAEQHRILQAEARGRGAACSILNRLIYENPARGAGGSHGPAAVE